MFTLVLIIAIVEFLIILLGSTLMISHMVKGVSEINAIVTTKDKSVKEKKLPEKEQIKERKLEREPIATKERRSDKPEQKMEKIPPKNRRLELEEEDDEDLVDYFSSYQPKTRNQIPNQGQKQNAVNRKPAEKIKNDRYTFEDEDDFDLSEEEFLSMINRRDVRGRNK